MWDRVGCGAGNTETVGLLACLVYFHAMQASGPETSANPLAGSSCAATVWRIKSAFSTCRATSAGSAPAAVTLCRASRDQRTR
jgi:hypothetical protein